MVHFHHGILLNSHNQQFSVFILIDLLASSKPSIPANHLFLLKHSLWFPWHGIMLVFLLFLCPNFSLSFSFWGSFSSVWLLNIGVLQIHWGHQSHSAKMVLFASLSFLPNQSCSLHDFNDCLLIMTPKLSSPVQSYLVGHTVLYICTTCSG